MPEQPPVVLELRVHGVHGTSPASMLGVASGDVRQVAGDGLTGFYRIADEAQPPLRRLPAGMALEAYSWGALTSGVQGALGWVKRVLWLLLLPFALVNLAYWARLRVGENSGRARWGARAVRLSGLLLTVFGVLTPCVIAVDLVAWQCFRGNSAGCPALPDQLDFMSGFTATQRLALGSLAPLFVVALLFALSRQSLSRYEEVKPPDGGWAAEPATEGPAEGPADGPAVAGFRHPSMWQGASLARRLQRLHVTVALATVVMFTGMHVLRPTIGPLGERGIAQMWAESAPLTLTTAAAALLAAAATVLACSVHHQDVEFHRNPRLWGRPAPVPHLFARLPRGTAGTITLVTAAVTAGHLLALYLGEFPGLDESSDFIGHNVWFITIFVLLTLLHLVVFTGGRMPAWGTALVALVVVALGVGGVWLYVGEPFGDDSLWVGAGAVLVFWAALASWHYRLVPWLLSRRVVPRRLRRRFERLRGELAWSGAAASMLLAGAVWVALLFTSATVTASADYLNGDHSVADLVSRSPETPATSALMEDQAMGRDVDLGRTPLTVTGDVEVSGAEVEVTGSRVTVRSGTVHVGTLAEPAEQVGSDLLRSTRFRSVRLVLPGSSVRLADSCVTTAGADGGSDPDEDCSGESASFRPGALLPVPRGVLQVEADDGSVLVAVADPPQIPLVVPQVLIWSPIVQLVWLVLVAGLVGWSAWLFGRRSGGGISAYVAEDPLRVPERDRPAAAAARRRAAFAHRAETLADLGGAATAPLGLLLVVASFTGRAPWQVLPWTRHVATVSLYAVVGLSAALVLLASQLRRSESTRRAVGVLWDLTTFWPRAAHPLAPPCYAERVVPELCTRVEWALSRPSPPGGTSVVVLSGHSQGSLIVMAVTSRLSSLHRVRLLTYGSQVRALYGRVFPGVVGADLIGYHPTTDRPSLTDPWPDVPPPPGPVRDEPPVPETDHLRGRLRQPSDWVNLFRRTDPLGYRVYADRDSELDVPTCEVPLIDVGDAGPRVMTHGGYQHTVEYRRVVRRWTGEELVEDPPGTTGLPPLPDA